MCGMALFSCALEGCLDNSTDGRCYLRSANSALGLGKRPRMVRLTPQVSHQRTEVTMFRLLTIAAAAVAALAISPAPASAKTPWTCR
jgi:hypothetical protein